MLCCALCLWVCWSSSPLLCSLFPHCLSGRHLLYRGWALVTSTRLYFRSAIVLPPFFLSILLSSPNYRIYFWFVFLQNSVCQVPYFVQTSPNSPVLKWVIISKSKFKVMTLNHVMCFLQTYCYSSGCSVLMHETWPSLVGSQKTMSIQNLIVFFAGSYITVQVGSLLHEPIHFLLRVFFPH